MDYAPENVLKLLVSNLLWLGQMGGLVVNILLIFISLAVDKCAHPDYKDQLKDYFDYASRKCLAAGMGHEPQMLDKVFKMHTNLMENGTMKLKSW